MLFQGQCGGVGSVSMRKQRFSRNKESGREKDGRQRENWPLFASWQVNVRIRMPKAEGRTIGRKKGEIGARGAFDPDERTRRKRFPLRRNV